jgi:hypothetical protein
MEFADQAAYDGYNEHPVHTAFVAERWVPEVGGSESGWIRLGPTAGPGLSG